jgi:hypothetical protein
MKICKVYFLAVVVSSCAHFNTSGPTSAISVCTPREPTSLRCEKLFEPRIFNSYDDEKRASAIQFGDHYSMRSTERLRVSQISNGHYQSWVRDYYPVRYMEQTAIVSRMENFKTSSNINVPVPANEEPWKEASESLDFVIDIYRERRPHWTPEFLEKLKKTARQYLADSTYITVKEDLGKKDGRIKGTLRLINERDGLLPMERYLGIQIDVGSDNKVEPGNFAISKEENQDAWPEIMMLLASDIVKNRGTGKTNHYLTYADIYSKSLYSKLGFKPVPADRIKLSPGVVLDDGGIYIDGIKWTPMEATQAEMDGLVDLHTRRLRARGIDPNEIESLESRRQFVNSNKRLQSQVISAPTLYEGQLYRGRISTAERDGSVWTYIFIERFDGKKWQYVENEIIANFDSKELPLKTGTVLTGKVYLNVNQNYKNGSFSYSYSNDHQIESMADPDFSFITEVRFLKHHKFQGLTLNF